MTKNLVKYTAAIFLSLIGSEILKLSTSFYIYKQTGNFWTVTLFYLMTQIPNLITYLLSGKFIKFNAKQCLVWSDVMSVVLLLILLMVFLVKNKSILSVLILIINSLIALVHAFRFIHLKNIIYFISDNFTNIKKYNWSNTWATSIALTTFLLLLLSLKNVDFWCLILLNIFTYITSGFYIWPWKLTFIYSKLVSWIIIN